MCSVVPAGAELRDVELFGGSTAGAPTLASCAPHTQYSPRARPTKCAHDHGHLPLSNPPDDAQPVRSRREDARSAQLCLVRPSNRRVASHLRTSHLPPHCHCRGRADATPGPAYLTRAPPPRHSPTRTRREGAGRAIAGLPAGSRPLKRSLTRPSLAAPLPAVAGDGVTNLGLSSVFLPLAPVGRPPRAGGKRRAEPSVTSWRAHGPPKGRTDPWLRRRLRRERRR